MKILSDPYVKTLGPSYKFLIISFDRTYEYCNYALTQGAVVIPPFKSLQLSVCLQFLEKHSSSMFRSWMIIEFHWNQLAVLTCHVKHVRQNTKKSACYEVSPPSCPSQRGKHFLREGSSCVYQKYQQPSIYHHWSNRHRFAAESWTNNGV